MEIQKFKYLKNEKSFLDEIKNIFHSFWRAIIWCKKNFNYALINERSLLIHSQIIFIKLVELNKFDNIYSKIWNVWPNFLKIRRVLIHKKKLRK